MFINVFNYRFRAMYNYKPQNEDEVELFEGKQK